MMTEIPSTKDANVFGKISMGYAIVESTRLSQWREFCEKGLGLHRDAETHELLAYRLDNHKRRFIVQYGSAEDFVCLGLQLADETVLATVLKRLEESGIAYEKGSDRDAALRGVTQFWRFAGPKGMALELFVDAELGDEPLHMLTSGFVTGEGGLGHVAITSRLPDQMCAFWQDIFDARISDYIEQNIAGTTLDITFLRLNERHHSVAVASTRGIQLDPIRTVVQHMNFQAARLEDLTSAFVRCRELGYEMAHEIGQHPNDNELSFYVISPSGFEMEIGWNALTVDEEKWQQKNYQGMSSWGHKPERNGALATFLLNLGNAIRGIASLLRAEYNPISGK